MTRKIFNQPDDQMPSLHTPSCKPRLPPTSADTIDDDLPRTDSTGLTVGSSIGYKDVRTSI